MADGHAIWAMVTADGVPIQESAVCKKHMADSTVLDTASDLGGNAEDIGEDHEFHEFDAEYAENNDLVCIGCSWEMNIDRDIKARLEYLRRQIRGEFISWGELAELQSLAERIEPGDVELLEWAGVPEHESEEG